MIKQGDLLKDVKYYKNFQAVSEGILVDEVNFPYVFVMNMSCDLEHSTDIRKPVFKNLFSILVCPAYTLRTFKFKVHTIMLEVSEYVIQSCYSKDDRFSRDEIRQIMQNNNPRYHFIDKRLIDTLEDDLVVDFKHFFTMDITDLTFVKNSGQFYGQLSDLYKEELTLRFSNYISRIGTPVLL